MNQTVRLSLNNAKRLLLKRVQLEMMGTALERSSKESKTEESRAKQAKIADERNEIEATFDQLIDFVAIRLKANYYITIIYSFDNSYLRTVIISIQK